MIHEQYTDYTNVSILRDVFVYLYQRFPILLVQVNTENMIVLGVLIYTFNHGHDRVLLNCLFLCISNTSVEDS
jgi:lantibiotic modifying enzyme